MKSKLNLKTETKMTADGRYILSPFRKWLGLFLVALGGGTIYLIPYLMSQYINNIQVITGESVTNLQLLITVYGAISLIFYIPGGWIADRFSTKMLFTFSMLGTGVVSLWYSLIGFNGIIDFSQLIIIHSLFAITTVLTFWSAFVKGVNLFGSADEQAILYSRCDLMRNIIGCICGFISVGLSAIVITGIFATPEGSSGMFFTILFYAIIYIITGVLCMFIMPGEWIQKSTKRNLEGIFEYRPAGSTKIFYANTKEELKVYKTEQLHVFWKQVGSDLIQSLKTPSMWLIAFLIFFTMNAYAAINSYGTLFTSSYGLNSQVSSFSSYLYNYGTPILGALLFGWISNKRTKSSSKAVLYSNIPLIAVIAIMIGLPLLSDNLATTNNVANSDMQIIAGIGIVLLSISMIFIGGSRAIYWSTMTETKIPLSIVGISSGLISIVGFSKDVWVGPTIASIIKPFGVAFGDANNEVIRYQPIAFTYIYIFALVNILFALLMSYIIYIRSKYGSFTGLLSYKILNYIKKDPNGLFSDTNLSELLGSNNTSNLKLFTLFKGMFKLNKLKTII